MDEDYLKKLNIEDLEGIAGGSDNFYDAVRDVYWDLYRMRLEGKTKEEAYAYCEEQYARFQPHIEQVIITYSNDIWNAPVYYY